MEQKFLKIFTAGIFISLFLFPTKAKSCGYYEAVWEYRSMVFQAQLPYMRGLDPFMYAMASVYYSMDSDPLNNDRKQNIEEWQNATSPKISFDDIYTIQYKTEPTDFIYAVEKNDLRKFAGNSFVDFLKESKNKGLLEYMIFAKKAESTEKYYSEATFESWNGINESSSRELKTILFQEADRKLKTKLSPFLQERYAFQLIRLSWQIEVTQLPISTYQRVFVKPNSNSLMNIWSCLFVAMSYDRMNEKEKANRYYSYAFKYSDEKKLRAIQLYNKGIAVDQEASYEDQSMHHVMASINYPGRSLESMESAFRLDQKNPFLSFMIKREINKLEEWLIDPLYLKTIVSPYDCAGWSNNYVDSTNYRFIEQNKETDIVYLRQLKKFIVKVKTSVKDKEERNFYNMTLAHLSLLDENSNEAKMYLEQISNTSNKTIEFQKLIEETWLAIQTNDITSTSFKQLFAKNMKKLEQTIPTNLPQYSSENYGRKDNIASRIFYTLNLSLASKYKKAGDIIHYALLKNKSDMYRTRAGDGVVDFYPADLEYWSYGSLYYQRIKQLDYHASTDDIDKYIALIDKTKKTDFENYLCNQFFLPTDAYRDLKGTIAFRKGDVDLAYKTFASMDQNYWKNNYEYKSYLNEDPFAPKWWMPNTERDFNYDFSKTKFVEILIELDKIAHSNDINKVAEAYLNLGHAYYNVSFYGNSWMMMSYGRSSGDGYFEKSYECLPEWRKEYFNCNKALEYYSKAFETAKENETKAFASLMLTGIYNMRSEPLKAVSDSINRAKYAQIYDDTYRGETNFDKQNECFGYQNFIK